MDEIKQARKDLKLGRESLRAQRRAFEAERASMRANVEASFAKMKADAEDLRSDMRAEIEEASAAMCSRSVADRAELTEGFERKQAALARQLDDALLNAHERTCVACQEKQRNTVCLPCGHVCVCEECIPMLNPKTCPICREVFMDVVKIFFS